MIQC
ncbi:Uncharacterised protein g1171 [Pycnogonum litorale]|jgi:hypothetical protein